MSRGQYLAMCLIGGVAVVAYLNSMRLEQTIRNIIKPKAVKPVGGGIF
jgi:hypothetical protein